jgi:murein L,D-transpeptidase YafK
LKKKIRKRKLNILIIALVGLALIFLAYWKFPNKRLPESAVADKVIVLKSKKRLILMNRDRALKIHKVALGKEPIGPKRCQGDLKTPEGNYKMDWKNAESRFHLSIHISYPNNADRVRAKRLGCSPGGDVMIHGLPDEWDWIGKLHRWRNWTNGCIAVTNPEIEEIWRSVPIGTPIEIRE